MLTTADMQRILGLGWISYRNHAKADMDQEMFMDMPPGPFKETNNETRRSRSQKAVH